LAFSKPGDKKGQKVPKSDIRPFQLSSGFCGMIIASRSRWRNILVSGSIQSLPPDWSREKMGRSHPPLALRALVALLFNLRRAVQGRAPSPFGRRHSSLVTCHLSSGLRHYAQNGTNFFGPFLVGKRLDFGCFINHLRKLAKNDGPVFKSRGSQPEPGRRNCPPEVRNPLTNKPGGGNYWW